MAPICILPIHTAPSSSMARKKVTLQRIGSDATRRATFKKRRNGLMKKASELGTLCGVDACVVVYGEGEAQPEVWPSVPEAARILARFKAMPELDQCKKMMDMEGFLKQRIAKLKEQLHKAQRENHDREAKLLLHEALAGRRPGLVGLTAEEIASLGWMVENRLRMVRDAMARLQGQGQGVPATALQLQLPPASLPLVPYSIDAGRTDVQMPQPQGWPMDMSRAGGELGALVYGGLFGGGRGSFGGAAAVPGASSSAGGDMLPLLGNVGAGFAWPDPAGPSFPSM
ncbi:hypothetical protein ACP70R_004922 [Stipagrostis hirtigluma subsp. patula]